MKAIKIREISRPDPKSLIMRPFPIPDTILAEKALVDPTGRIIRRPHPTTILARPEFGNFSLINQNGQGLG